jgi:hypothetical protein
MSNLEPINIDGTSNFKPVDGGVYKKQEVYGVLLAIINSGKVKNKIQKQDYADRIHALNSELIKFQSTGPRWGSSPMNYYCWSEVSL